jgi:hypothetical protein
MSMKKFLASTFLVVWIAATSYAVTMMHSWHYSDLGPKNKISFKKLDFSNSEQNIGVIHFLTPLCSCSKEVFKHLVDKGPLQNKVYKERVILIDDQKKEFMNTLLAKGFDVVNLDSETIKTQFEGDIKGVPLLAIFDREFKTRYVGGYSDKSITPFTQINYRNFLEQLKTKQKIKSLPVIGCAVSKEYKKLLDPFGLKYGVVQ